MAKFFIDRPIFAWVVAIFIVIAGIFSTTRLAVEQYPNVAAPQITISFVYPGASAETLQDAVISVIEEQMNAAENIDYMESQAYSNGRGEIRLTFLAGSDEDFAQVEVQNKLSQAEPRLPQAVRENGIIVARTLSNFLAFVTLSAKEDAELSLREIGDYAVRTVKPELQRVKGIGDVQVFASEQAMRIWVDPGKLKKYDLSFAAVVNAIRAQNTQVTAGSLGALPSVPGQSVTYGIDVYGQLQDTEQFGDIVVKHSEGGATVRVKDVAEVALGNQSYASAARLDGQPAVGIGVQLSSSGNAIETVAEIRRRMENLASHFPPGIAWQMPYDTSKFASISIEKVLHTLVEAVFLVFLVMFLFLQNIRYTLIPTIVVPVSLFGAMAIMYPLGLSINLLSMFAMVLVIGIVVDDAIVVVENVERLMAEEGLTPYEATRKGMGQITGAIVGITLVLVSVFVPMAFFGGATGEIYRQFALVMTAAIAVSALMALSLTPALCVTLLKPVGGEDHRKNGFFGFFNRGVKRATRSYKYFLGRLVRFTVVVMLVFVVLTAGGVFTHHKVPTSFLPSEDQGFVLLNYQLPSDATRERTEKVIAQTEELLLAQKEVESILTLVGFNIFGHQGQNMAFGFVPLKDWSERKAAGEDADSLAQRFTGMIMQKINQALVFAFNIPPIAELGVSSGWEMRLQDREGAGHAALLGARNQLLGMMMQSKVLAEPRPTGLEDAPQIVVTIDRDKAYAQNVSFSAIAATLSSAFGASYVNDFPNKGRMQRVYVQAKAAARMQEADILDLDVPSDDGRLVPLATVARLDKEQAPLQITRYNGYPAMMISGKAAPGYSSGEAMREVERLVAALPQGFAIEWAGMSLEEVRVGNSSLYLYAFSVLAIFLCLAALYESWSIPFSVLLVLPLGFLGVVLGNYFRGYDNDIFFRVGMITVMGLSAKNAILIIEFAKDLQAQGMSKVQAALAAANLRFRPIIMTSLAFIAGVVPLYFANGASSASQRAVGTSVLWGMLVGTALAIFFVPIYYVVVRKIFGSPRENKDRYALPSGDAEASETHAAKEGR